MEHCLSLTSPTDSAEEPDSLCELFSKLDALHVELLPETFNSFPGPSRPLDLLREKLKSQDKALFVAVVGDKLVGFTDIQRSSNPPYPMFKPREYALIDNIFVLDDFRGTGLAHSFFEHAKSWAKEHGLSNLQLKVYNANRAAIRFYEKEGMRQLNTTYELDSE